MGRRMAGLVGQWQLGQLVELERRLEQPGLERRLQQPEHGPGGGVQRPQLLRDLEKNCCMVHVIIYILSV